MKIIFFGSSHFALPALEALIKSRNEILCVVTQPDKRQGRHLHLGATDVKSSAISAGLKVYQPENINSQEALNYLKGFNADLFVVVAYGQILSQQVLDIPELFAANIHASLLPKYRGAAPINWAVIKGEQVTGVSIIKLIRKMDAGPVLAQKKMDITGKDDAVILESKLSKLGAELIIDTLKYIKNQTFKLIPQDENRVVMAPKLKKDAGRIDWSMPAIDILNLIRGCLPWPGAFTYYKSKLLKVYKAQVTAQGIGVSGHQVPGEIVNVSKSGIEIKTRNGSLLIEELQIEGKRKMSVAEFITGHKISAGETLGRK